MMNVGNPELAFEFQRLPNEGVGLARLEFIINKNVGVHPKALIELDRQRADLRARDRAAHRRLREPDRVLRRQDHRRRGHDRRRVLAEEGDRAAVGLQVERVLEPDRRPSATSRTRKIRCSGFAARRATSSPDFYDCFALECQAMKRVRDDMGLTNVELMVPFVRTLARSGAGDRRCWRRTASRAARTACA